MTLSQTQPETVTGDAVPEATGDVPAPGDAKAPAAALLPRTYDGDDLVLQGVAAVALLLVTKPDHAGFEEVSRAWDEYEARVRVDPVACPLTELLARLPLDTFELRCLLLLIGMHTEPLLNRLVAQVEDQPLAVGLTVRAVLRHLLHDAASRLTGRRSFLPGAPLVDRDIITLGVLEGHSEDGLLDRPLLLTNPGVRFLLSERAVPRLRTALYEMERPDVMLQDVVLPLERIEAFRRFAAVQAATWTDIWQGRAPNATRILLSGPNGSGKSMLSRALANHLGCPLLVLRATSLPHGPGLTEALRDLFADAWLVRGLVVLETCDAILRPEDSRRALVLDALDEFDGLVLLHTSEPGLLDGAIERRLSFHFALRLPDATARHQIWEVHLPPDVPLGDDVDLGALASRFDFDGGTIAKAAAQAAKMAREQAGEGSQTLVTQQHLLNSCFAQVPEIADDLVVRVQGSHTMADIVLPTEAQKVIHEFLDACRNQSTVLSQWGFGRRLATGKGVVAIFDGPPGTGKTFCAEIIASELGRPLHRVNIAEVVSKWVGETQKHIRQVFQQARITHAVLLFDEADSLFSSRVGEARTSQDRQANMEVNLLLQEIERFPGVCILTTNLFGAIDPAMKRRILFRASFDEPTVEQRERIWSLLCPPEAPRASDVDFAALAKTFELNGALIKNALLRAAYRACAAGVPLSQQQMVESCIDEYKAAGKLYRPHKPKPRRHGEDRVEVKVDASGTPARTLPDDRTERQ